MVRKFVSLFPIIMTAFIFVCAGSFIGCSVFSVTVSAASIVENGECGEDLNYTLDSKGVLTVFGEGDMYDYEKSESPFTSCEKIKTIILEDGVTSVGDYAFYKCEKVSSITFPNSMSDVGSFCFAACFGIKDLIIPGNIENIGGYAFYACDNLKNVIIDDGVKSIGERTFDGCTNIENLEIPGSILTIGKGAFSSCNKLSSINVESNNNYYSSIDGVLFNKNQSELIQYPIGKQNKMYTVPESVSSIGEYAFYNSNLTNLIISDTVTDIGYQAFKYCRLLTNIVIGNNVKSIGNGAFTICENLIKVIIPSSVQNIGTEPFYGCRQLTEIDVSEGNLYYSSVDGVLFDKSQENLIKYPENRNDLFYSIPNGTSSVKSEAFDNAYILKIVSIPNSVKQIDYGAFDGSYNLTDIYYNGSIEQWNNIKISSANEPITNANIHFTDNNHIHDFTVVEEANDCILNVSRTYYCEKCGEMLTIHGPGHIDANEDGKCDACDQKMSGDGYCKYCGKIHSNKFDYLGFLHKILYFFAHIFGIM